MTRRSAARRPVTAAALGAALLAAGLASCRDAATAPRPQPAAQAAAGLRRDVGVGPAIDPGFDPNDTQVEVEMYVDRVYDLALDSTIADPITGAPTSVLHTEAPPEHLLVRGGYDLAGFPRFAVTDLNLLNGTGEGSGVLTIGGPNDITVYGADGTPVDAVPPLGEATGVNPLGLLGLDQTTDITAGLVGGDPSLGVAAAPRSPNVTLGAPAPAGATSAGVGQMRAVAPGVLQERTPFARGSMTRTFQRGRDGVARLSVVEVTAERPGRSPGASASRTLTRQRYVRVDLRAVAARDAARAARRAARKSNEASPATGPGLGAAPNGSGREPASKFETQGTAPARAGAVLAPAGAANASSTALFTGFAYEGCGYYGWCPPFIPSGGSGGCTYYSYCFPPLPNGNPMNPCFASYWGPGFCLPPKNYPRSDSLGATTQLTGILLQHGIDSGRGTWDWMQGYLAVRYGASVPTAAFSLHWQDPIENQALELERDIATWPGNYVFVGHSQGGLLARYLYQRAQDSPVHTVSGAPLAGVVTIGSPAEGAPIANVLPPIQRALQGALSDVRANDCVNVRSLNTAGGCYVVTRLGAYVEGPMLALAQSASLPELRPGSAFLALLSRVGERFHRANISSYADPRWVLFRTAGDAVGTCAPDDNTCNGAGFAKKVEDAYKQLRACAVVSPWMRLAPPLVQAARGCGEVAAALDQLDQSWKLATQGSDPTTDGIVPGGSQHSDGHRGCLVLFSSCSSPSQTVIYGGPSHAGETASPLVYRELQRVLDREFQVGYH